jgi:acetyl-CoA C-acetyltransferase
MSRKSLNMVSVPGNTPILVGAGQYTDHMNTPQFAGLSPQALAARAVELALFDAGIAADRQSLDALVAVRTVRGCSGGVIALVVAGL